MDDSYEEFVPRKWMEGAEAPRERDEMLYDPRIDPQPFSSAGEFFVPKNGRCSPIRAGLLKPQLMDDTYRETARDIMLSYPWPRPIGRCSPVRAGEPMHGYKEFKFTPASNIEISLVDGADVEVMRGIEEHFRKKYEEFIFGSAGTPAHDPGQTFTHIKYR